MQDPDGDSQGPDNVGTGERAGFDELDLDALRGLAEQRRAKRQAALKDLGGDRDAWLAAIVDAYLGSRDYNGFAVHDGFPDRGAQAVAGLIKERLIEIRTSEMSMNPHIRRLPTSMSPHDQADLVRAGDCERYVLYPTSRALATELRVTALTERPYEQRMAAGAAVLEVAFFELAVLENYRNDPRYTFSYWDFGVQFSIGDEAYLDPDESERDKVSAAHVGFAYSEDTRPDGPIRRYLAVFVKDLAAMTPEHQQRWHTYEAESDNIQPHPEWYASQVDGVWPTGSGPFAACLTEMGNINELAEMLWGRPLFGDVSRPREWGWMIRGSKLAYREFAHLTDKLLAENLKHDGLTAAGAPKEKDSNHLGTLKRLEALLVRLGVPEEAAYMAMGAWHDMNNERQRQAHALDENTVDLDLLVAQVATLRRLVNSLVGIRMVLAKQVGAEWEPDYEPERFFLL